MIVVCNGHVWCDCGVCPGVSGDVVVRSGVIGGVYERGLE